MTSAQRARTYEYILEKYSADASFDTIEVELAHALSGLEPNQRVTFLTSLAETALARGDAARAIPFCRSLLEGPDLPPETLEVVERLSEAGEDAELLRRVLELTVKRAPKASIRARALERLGDFFDAWQHDTQRATKSWRAAALQFSNEPAEINDSRRLYERVLSTAPSDSLSATKLVELSVTAGDWLGAAGAFDALLHSSPSAQEVCELLLLLEPQAETPDGGEQFAALVDAARWQFGNALGPYALRLSEASARVLAAAGRHDKAAEAYRALIEAHASDVHVRQFEALIDSGPSAEWRRRQGAWLFDWRCGRAKDPTPLLLAWGEREDREFGDYAAAIETYQRITRRDPTSALAWAALARLKVRTGDIDGALEAVTHLRGTVEHAVASVAAAAALIEKLDEPLKALALLEEVLARHPDHAEARELLLVLIKSRGPAQLPACRLLLRDDRYAGKASDRLTLLRELFAGDLPADLAEELGLELVPLAERDAESARLVHALWLRMLELAPRARWALDRVKFVLSTERRWPELFKLYERAAESESEPTKRADWLDEAALVARDIAQDEDRAQAFWERCLELRPEDPRVDAALTRLYERRKLWSKLVAHLERRLPHSQGEAQRSLYCKIANLHLEARDPAAALTPIRELFKADPDGGLAFDLLERLLRLGDEHREAVASEAKRQALQEAADMLSGEYARLSRPAELERVLRLELAWPAAPAQRAKLLRQLAEVEEGSGELEACFKTRSELLALEPSSERTLLDLKRIAAPLGAQSSLAALLSELGSRITPPEVATMLLVESAHIYLHDVGDSPHAAEVYAKVLREASDQAALLEAGQALDRLYRDLGKTAERCGVLETLARIEPDAEARRRALTTAAELSLSVLGDASRAVTQLSALQRELPDDQAVHDKLIAALRSARRPRELVEALTRRAGFGLPGARDDLIEAARICDQELRDLDRARQLWLEIRDRFGLGDAGLEALTSILERRNALEELTDVLRDAAEKSSRPAPLYCRLAQVLSRRGLMVEAVEAHIKGGELGLAVTMLDTDHTLLPESGAPALLLAAELVRTGQPERAMHVLELQLSVHGQLQSRSAGLVQFELAKLLIGAGQREAALKKLELAAQLRPGSAEVLIELAALAADCDELALAENSLRALLLALPHNGEPPLRARASVYLDLNAVLERAGRAEEAENFLTSAFDQALLSDAEAQGLEEGLRRRSRLDLLERALRLRLRSERPPLERASALLEVVGLTKSPTNDTELCSLMVEVAEQLTRAEASAGLDGEALSLFRRLARNCRDAEQPRAALGLLRQAVARASQEREAVERELVELLITLPDGRSEARERLERLVEGGQADAADTALFVRLLEEDGELARTIESITTKLARAKTDGDAARVQQLRLTLGVLYERNGQAQEALRVFRMAALRPTRRAEALGAVLRVLQANGGSAAERADVLEQLLTVQGAAPQVHHVERLLELRRQQGDAEAIERALHFGAKLVPGRADWRNELLGSCEERGDWETAATLLERASAASPNDTALRLELGRHLRRAGRLEQALATLQALSATESSARLHHELYQSLRDAGQHEAALLQMERASELDAKLVSELLTAIEDTPLASTSERWVLRFAELCRDMGETQRALDYLARAIDAQRATVSVLALAASLAAKQRDADNAINWLRAATNAARGTEQIRLARELMTVCTTLDRAGEGVAELERVCARNPEAKSELWSVLRKALAQSGQHAKEAELLLERAQLEKPSEKQKLALEAAFSFERAGAHARTLAVALELIEHKAEQLEPRLLGARALSALGKSAEAVELLQPLVAGGERAKARGLKPVWRLMAEIHLGADELDEALPFLVHAHKLDRADLELALLLGLTAMDLDDFDNGPAALRLVVVGHERHAPSTKSMTPAQLSQVYFQLALFEAHKGHGTAARRLVTRALELRPDFADAQRLRAELA